MGGLRGAQGQDGRRFVQLVVSSRRAEVGYASIYYPGTLQSATATAVTLGISEERSGVDFQLLAVPLATVSGSVIGPDGGLPPGGQVRLVETNALIPGFKVYSSPIRNDGTLTINGVPPGQDTLLARTNSRVIMRLNGDATVELQSKTYEYAIDVAPARKAAVLGELQAQASAGGPEPLWGQSEISVDGCPLTNVVLQLQRGFEVSGSYAFEGTPPQPPDLAGAIHAGAGFDGHVHALQPQPASITRRPLHPSRRDAGPVSSECHGPAGGLEVAIGDVRRTRRARHDVRRQRRRRAYGRDRHVHESIERAVRQSDNIKSGKPVPDFTIVVFPSDRRFWTPQSRRIQAMRPSTDGRFSFRNLPAGDYRLIAVVDPEPGEWFDPAFLDQLVGATIPITIADGERKVQDVRISR